MVLPRCYLNTRLTERENPVTPLPVYRMTCPVVVAVSRATVPKFHTLTFSRLHDKTRAVSGPLDLRGKDKTLLPSTSLPLMDEIPVSTRHYWADVFLVRRLGLDGRKGSTTNSTVRPREEWAPSSCTLPLRVTTKEVIFGAPMTPTV